jgi:nucleoside-diphosphate-sugar epimerase
VDAGYSVRRLVRSPRPGTDDRLFVLGDDPDPEAVRGVDLLIHGAYDMGVTSRRDIWTRNVFGSVRLLDASVTARVRRTIVVSSMSAYAGTRQLYGRAKLDVELAAFNRGMEVIRPGLVYGPGWGGMAGTLRRLCGLPVLPDFGPRAAQFTVHEDDLAAAFLAVGHAADAPAVPLGAAHPVAVAFGDLLTSLAVDQGRPGPRFVPVPAALALAGLRSAEAVGVPLPVRADSFLGLVRPAGAVANIDVLTGLGVTFRPFGEQTVPPTSGRRAAG